MELRWHKSAARELELLDSSLANRVLDKIDESAKNPSHFLEGLTGTKFYKLRVGDYRVIVEWDRKNQILYIQMLGHRKSIYKKLGKNLDE